MRVKYQQCNPMPELNLLQETEKTLMADIVLLVCLAIQTLTSKFQVITCM